MRLGAALVGAAMVLGGVAAARPKATKVAKVATASALPAPAIDWAAGELVATAWGLADRHAPSPAVARGTARRPAEDAARAKLAALALTVPLASGGAVASRLGDPAIKARLDAAVAAAIVRDAAPETDGSWRVTMALPLEAIRQALDGGPRVLPAVGDVGPAVVVVEGVTMAPALGVKIGGAAGAVRWVREVPAFAAGAVVVQAGAGRDGEIEVAAGSGGAGTLWIVRVGR